MRLRSWIAGVAPALLAGAGVGAEPTLEAQIERHVQPLIESGLTPGVSVSVYRNGEVQHFGFGAVSYADTAPAPDENTIYEIGSITKVFTGLLLADAVRRGEVALDDPLSALLPGRIHAPTFDGDEITLVQLATHTSSLPRMPGNFSPRDSRDPYSDYTRKDLLEFLGTWTPERAPGVELEYSNLGAGLLGQLLADQAGVSYATLARTRITKPLGLNDTGAQPPRRDAARTATPHRFGEPWSFWRFDALAGAGSLRSTSSDLLQFLVINLDPPEGELGEAIRLSHIPRFTTPSNQQIALGWHITGQGNVYWHNGQTGGFSSFAMFDRRSDLALVMLANGACKEITPAGFNILRVLLGLDPDPVEIERNDD